MKTVNVTCEIVGTGKNLYNVSIWPDGWESPSVWLAAGDTEAEAIEAATLDLLKEPLESVEREEIEHSEAFIIGTFCHG